MTRSRAALVALGLTAISAGISAWAYPHAPAIVPTHWDAAGHVNGYMPKFWGLAIWPLTIAGTLLLMLVLPTISPKGFRMESFANVYYLIVIVIAAVLLINEVFAVRASLGTGMPVGSAVLLPISVLFLILGNYMGKLRKNFFIGVRTPWTLASDEVWLRTHRFTGHLFTIGGLVLIPVSIFVGAVPGTALGIWGAIVVAMVIAPILYSFIAYRQIEGFSDDG